MKHIEHYIANRAIYPKLIQNTINPLTGISVVIPCFNEPNLLASLKALYACSRPMCTVEVIVVINSSETTNDEILQQNKKTFVEVQQWLSLRTENWISTYLIHKDKLPKKHAGVGMARKIGMDEAVRRFHEIGNDKGVICGFDADSVCANNYFIEIELIFSKNPSIDACSLYFEHPVSGEEFDNEVYRRIIQYELYLRYYNQALRSINHPHAYHTIGSAFCVRADTYAKQGGMNKRKAGEDFYFLQKIIPLGNYNEIATTEIYPSPRPSDRVPFGTGAAIAKMLCSNSPDYPTYHPDAFNILSIVFEEIQNHYRSKELYQKLICNTEIHPSVKQFLEQNNFASALEGMMSNSNSLPTFLNRFYAWFNAFRVLKFLNFAHPDYFPFVPIKNASQIILSKILKNSNYFHSEYDLLMQFRAIEKNK